MDRYKLTNTINTTHLCKFWYIMENIGYQKIHNIYWYEESMEY